MQKSITSQRNSQMSRFNIRVPKYVRNAVKSTTDHYLTFVLRWFETH